MRPWLNVSLTARTKGLTRDALEKAAGGDPRTYIKEALSKAEGGDA
jgi:hypothetical protein